MFKLAAIFIFILNYAYAENIDPYNDNSQYAYGENVGWINFEPGVAGPNGGVTVSSEKLTGFIWAENIGWINLSPQAFGGVFNDGYGNLSGYAWAENAGWINFDPTYGDVIIADDGEFSGWAWGENIGWINFNSASLYGHAVKACKVDFKDFAFFAEYWLESGSGLPADLYGDNTVNLLDLDAFVYEWPYYCPYAWPLK